MKDTYETGIRGEDKAAEYLCMHGMKLLEKRFKSKCGEIDLILLDADTLVFVEVKTRLTGPAGSGLLAVTPSKQHRIANTAKLYLKKYNLSRRNIRFDVIEISREGILHIPNAFQPGGMIC